MSLVPLLSRKFPKYESLREFYVGESSQDLDHRTNGASCICFDENDSQKVLLVKHRRRGREYVSGSREKGENITQAIIRELQEEAGVQKILDLKPFGYIQISPLAKDVPHDYILIHTGKADPQKVSGPAEDEDEILEHRFFDMSEIGELGLSEDQVMVIEEAHKNHILTK